MTPLPEIIEQSTRTTQLQKDVVNVNTVATNNVSTPSSSLETKSVANGTAAEKKQRIPPAPTPSIESQIPPHVLKLLDCIPELPARRPFSLLRSMSQAELKAEAAFSAAQLLKRLLKYQNDDTANPAALLPLFNPGSVSASTTATTINNAIDVEHVYGNRVSLKTLFLFDLLMM